MSETPATAKSHANEAVWTPEAVGRFWDYWSARVDFHDEYFTLQVGRGISYFASLAGILKGKVLDYGCGPGYLLDRLLEQSAEVAALDFSQEAVQQVNARHAGNPRWL